jgi:hypothetical protein
LTRQNGTNQSTINRRAHCQGADDDARTLVSLLTQRGLPARPLLVALYAAMARLPVR